MRLVRTFTTFLVLSSAVQVIAQGALWSGYIDQGRRAFDQGDYRDAAELFEAAVDEVEALPQDPRLAEALFELGRTQRRLGQSEIAEGNLRRALEIFEAELGSGAPQVAGTMVELGASHRQAGELDLAEPMLRRAAAIREATSAPNAPELLAALREVALLALERGDFVQAETVYRRVLAGATQSYSPDSPQMTEALLPMGQIYVAKGEYDRALPMFRRALSAASQRQRGVVLAELAETHRLMGDSAESEDYWLQAVEHYGAVEATPDSVQTLYRFAEYLRQQDRYDEAEPHFELALEHGIEVHGKGARELIPIFEDYASLLWRTGRKLRSSRMQAQARWIRTRKGKEGSKRAEQKKSD